MLWLIHALPDIGKLIENESSFRHLAALVNAGKEVILFAHSYGAVPASGAASGWSKWTRQRNAMKGGVIGMIFMCGFLIPEGTSLLGFMEEHIPDYKYGSVGWLDILRRWYRY